MSVENNGQESWEIEDSTRSEEEGGNKMFNGLAKNISSVCKTDVFKMDQWINS